MTPETLVLVIGLADARDRRAGFTACAGGTSLPWKFLDAHPELGPGLTYRPEDAMVAKGRPLMPGELGCCSSHHHAWFTLLDSGASQIVLEDDTILDWTFLDKLARVDFAARGVSYLRLFAKRPCAFRLHGGAIEPQRYLVEYAAYAHGPPGYVLTRSSAERLVRHCGRVRRPVLVELDRARNHGAPCLAVLPFPLTEISTASTIGTARRTRPEVPTGLRFTRLRMRVGERARRIARWMRVMGRLRSPASGLRPQ